MKGFLRCLLNWAGFRVVLVCVALVFTSHVFNRMWMLMLEEIPNRDPAVVFHSGVLFGFLFLLFSALFYVLLSDFRLLALRIMDVPDRAE